MVKSSSYHEPFYDGAIYSAIFERLLAGLHQRISAHIEEGSTCLDACCGPGGLTFRLAGKCFQVVGVDISTKMISRAKKLKIKRKMENVEFYVADISRLEMFSPAQFDIATIAMGLHEMPAHVRSQVLPQLLRLAEKVVVVDFVAPMPRNFAGYRNRLIERLAGFRHYRGFKDYCQCGGLHTLIDQSGARVDYERKFDSGTLQLIVISSG